MCKNDIFLKTKKFGDLYLKDCISYYEYPRIFTCRADSSNAFFLFYEMESGGSFDKWLVAEISNDEYRALFEKKKSVQNIYMSRPKEGLWTICNVYGKDEDIATETNNGSIWLKDLPNKDIFPE